MVKPRLLLAWSMAALAVLGACATVRHHGEGDALVPAGHVVSIAPQVSLTLPPVPGYPGTFDAVQTLVARHDGRTQAFEAVVHADEASVSVLVTMVNGPRLMEVVWNADGISESRSAMTPESLSGLNILADIVLVNWPVEQVQAALPPDVTLIETDGARTVERADVPLIEITREIPVSNGRMRRTLRNLDLSYELTITSAKSPMPTDQASP